MQSNETNSKKINKLNLVLSVAIAFASWLYVVYSINPTISRTYTNIPVTVANTKTIDKKDIEVIKIYK